VAMRDRPLSPHLSVYKFKYTLLTSILNRLTGVALTASVPLLIYWLAALSSDAATYQAALSCLAHPIAKVIYAMVLLAFCYHTVAGIRHLIWDTGCGMERAQSYRSAWWVALATAVLFTVLGYGVLL
jgi:succinate dehydrogenase / fumarate reductase, cytochrome b subunit